MWRYSFGNSFTAFEENYFHGEKIKQVSNLFKFHNDWFLHRKVRFVLRYWLLSQWSITIPTPASVLKHAAVGQKCFEKYPYSILAGNSAFRVTLSTFFFFVTLMLFVFHSLPPRLHGFVVTDTSWAHTLGGEHVPLSFWVRQHRNRTNLTATPLLRGGNLWLLLSWKHPVLHLFHGTKQIKMVKNFPSLSKVKSGDLHLTTAKNLLLKIFWAQSLVK